MEIAIITEQMLKENSPITDNAAIKGFIPYIGFAQKIFIEPIIGEELMQELQEQIKADELTPLNSALIVRIAPALAHYAVYQGLPYHWATIQNKGLTIRDSENSRAVTIDDLSQMKRWILNDAEVFSRILEQYLIKCKENYPLYRAPSKCNGGSKSIFEGGIYFKKKVR